jgi:hypothetical protein
VGPDRFSDRTCIAAGLWCERRIVRQDVGESNVDHDSRISEYNLTGHRRSTHYASTTD